MSARFTGVGIFGSTPKTAARLTGNARGIGLMTFNLINPVSVWKLSVINSPAHIVVDNFSD